MNPIENVCNDLLAYSQFSSDVEDVLLQIISMSREVYHRNFELENTNIELKYKLKELTNELIDISEYID
jgi:hypothetical protein